jgi:hypothetical protein
VKEEEEFKLQAERSEMPIEKSEIKSSPSSRNDDSQFQGSYTIKANPKSVNNVKFQSFQGLKVPSFVKFSEDLLFTLTFLSKINGESERILYMEHKFQILDVDDWNVKKKSHHEIQKFYSFSWWKHIKIIERSGFFQKLLHCLKFHESWIQKKIDNHKD